MNLTNASIVEVQKVRACAQVEIQKPEVVHYDPLFTNSLPFLHLFYTNLTACHIHRANQIRLLYLTVFFTPSQLVVHSKLHHVIYKLNPQFVL